MPDAPSLSLSLDGDVVTASWTSPNDGGAPIEGFRVEYLGPQDRYPYQEWRTGRDIREVSFADVPCGLDVIVGLVAYNSVGDSVQTSERIRTEACRVPGAPSLSLSLDGDVVTASWDAPYDGGAPIEGFSLTWLGSRDRYSESDLEFSPRARSYRFDNLPCGLDVIVGLVAYNSVGDSVQTSERIRTEACRVPGAPSLSLSLDGDVVTASWDAPYDGGAPIEGFRLEWLGSQSPYSKAEWNTRSSTRRFRFKNVPCGLDVVVGLVAVNSVGESAQSREPIWSRDCPEVRIYRGSRVEGDRIDGRRCRGCYWIEMELINFLPGEYKWACVHSGSQNFPNTPRVFYSSIGRWVGPDGVPYTGGPPIEVNRSNTTVNARRCAAAPGFIDGPVYMIVGYVYVEDGGDASTISNYTKGVKSNEIDW